MRGVIHVLFWSIISAAFIGPGTITTAASAGAGHGVALLWALTFSTVACLVLQEAAARLTIVSGRDLGQAIRERFCEGALGVLVPGTVLGAIVLGCAAYEAGNLLGGVEGAVLGTGLPRVWLTLAGGGVAFGLLWLGTTRTVPRVLGGVVAFMGVAFFVTAVRLSPDPSELVRGTLLPRLPPGSPLLVLALIGTTVVPYNLFLGSGIARGQTLRELRFGLGIAIVLGGLISMAVLVVGTAVDPPLAFEALGRALRERMGAWAEGLFAGGLLAAGLSSAITAPLAAAVAARSLLSRQASAEDLGHDPPWQERSWRFRGVWLLILVTGMGFGLAQVKPIPAIVLAQALNGLLLPFVAVFLLLLVNDVRVMGRAGLNGVLSNATMCVVVVVTVVLGTLNLTRAVATAAGLTPPTGGWLLLGAGLVVLIVAHPVARALRSRRRAG
ncbi:MAG: divalent metal cation transporter [Acidobacteriota bacterium]|jgi:Mn2+/Fe2+ NRAMP family transporter